MGKNKNKQTSLEIGKAFGVKIIETLQALQLLRDSISAVREGKTYHLAVLSGQLRALLIDKASNSERRLLFIADQLGIALNIYCMPSVDDTSFPLPDKPLFWVSGFPITIQRQFKNQRELPLSAVLDEPFILYDGVRYSPRKIIEWFANRAGGSHYSSSLPKPFVDMLNIQIQGIDPLSNILTQIADSTLKSGANLVKLLSSQQIHMLVGVIGAPSADAYLLDAAYPNARMRFSLLINSSRMPIAQFIGIDGSWITVVCDRYIEWDRLRHLTISMNLNERLFTVVEMHIDGDLVGSVELKAPLFVIHEWQDFDVYHNRAVDGDPQDFSFAMSDLIVGGAELSSTDRANLLLYEEQRRNDPETKVILYEPFGFGRSAAGESDVKMEGKVTFSRAKNLWSTTAEA